MESSSALQESASNAPYMYNAFCTENETVPKLGLDPKSHIDVQNKNSRYCESGTLFSVPQGRNIENKAIEQDFKQIEPSHSINEELRKENLIHNSRNEVYFKSSKGEENGVSDLDSSTGFGKASSGYCTDTSEKEEFAADESIAHRVIKPSCSEDLPPETSCSAAGTAQAAKSSARSRSRHVKSRTYALRSRSKSSTTEVPNPPPPPPPQEDDLLPFDMDRLVQCDYKPVTAEEIYLQKLIRQLDSTYTKAVVVVTRLEMNSSLWKKYLGK